MSGRRKPWPPEVWVRVFLTKVRRTAAGCWEWTGQLSGRKDTGGQYGHVSKDGRMQYAHRAYWEHDRGPVPAGFELDHLCRNRVCVNPDHLEVVTRSENLRRGIPGQLLERCRSGLHEMSGADVIIDADGSRHCRPCARERHTVWQRERRRLTHVHSS